MNRNGLEIKHGIYVSGGYPVYRNTLQIISDVPAKFRQLLEEKWHEHLYYVENPFEWNGQLEFTFTRDEESNICSIAIVHPKDHFSRKIGNKITTGRIRRMKGDVKKYIYDTEVVDERKRIKLDEKGEPVVAGEVYYKPYASTPKWIALP